MKIHIKPLSVNRCWQGRRFKTKEYLQYEKDLSWFLKGEKIKGEIEINYKFYLNKGYKLSDIDNFSKPLTDIIVKNKLIDDDRFIIKMTLEKFKSKQDYIEIIIKKYEN